MPQTDPVMFKMLRMRLMAIALASLSGGSVYASCELAGAGAAAATGAFAFSVVVFCAASTCGKTPAKNAAEQTTTRAMRLNLNPILPLPANSARIEQTHAFAKISSTHAQPF